MNDNLSNNRDILDKALTAYEVTAQLWMYEGQLTWSIFNAMLVANSIIMAASDLSNSDLLSLFLPLLGIVLCVIWFFFNARGFEVHDYRVLSTREIEEQHLAPVSEVVSRGARFHAGKPVKLIIDGEEITRKLTRCASIGNTKCLAYTIILMFIAAHVAFLVAAIFGI